MVKKIITGYTIFSLIFFMVLVGHFSARLKTLYDRNDDTINKSFKEIANELKSGFLSTNSVEQSIFFARLKNKVLEDKQLELLTIYSPANGPLFIYTENKNLLRESAHNRPLYLKSTGAPLYTENPLHRLGTQTKTEFFAEVTGSRYLLDAFYTVISPAELYPYLFNSLVVLGVFFIASIILYALLATVKPASPSAPSTHMAAAPADGMAAKAEYDQDYDEPAYNEAHDEASASGASPGGSANEALAQAQSRRRQFVEQKLEKKNPNRTAHTPKNLFSPFTGLGWQEHLLHKLKFELERAASFDQDLVLVILAIDNYQELAEPSHLYKQVAELLLQDYKYPDLIFEYGAGQFALLLPDLDLDEGVKSMELFKNNVVSMPWGGITITCGLSARNGRLVEENRLLQEAVSALSRARAEGKNQMMIFKADPGQYREYLNKNR